MYAFMRTVIAVKNQWKIQRERFCRIDSVEACFCLLVIYHSHFIITDMSHTWYSTGFTDHITKVTVRRRLQENNE